MVTYFKVIIIQYFYLYRLIEKYARKCIYVLEAFKWTMKLNLMADIYMQMNHYINAYSLIYYNKYFGAQILPFTELFFFT